jgi:hypothetical protein
MEERKGGERNGVEGEQRLCRRSCFLREERGENYISE